MICWTRSRKGRIERIVITKRGRPVVTAPVPGEVGIEGLFGCMKDHTIPKAAIDLTAPTTTDLPSTADGILHW